MSELPWGDWSLILLIFAVSAFAQGVIGFAFGIVAMTLLPLVMGFKDAVALLAILNAGVMLFALYWQRSSFRWGDARNLVIGSLIGIPVGAYMVGALPERILFIGLGATMVAICINHFVKRKQAAQPPLGKSAVFIGAASGILAAGFNMGGPPLVAYIYSRDWKLDQAKAVLASCFVVTGISRLAFLGLTGVQLPALFKLAAIMLTPTVLVLWLGIQIGHCIPQLWLRPAVFAYLGLVGLYYLVLR